MESSLTPKKTILDAQQMRRAIRRMAGEILERNRGTADLLLVGIVTRGVPLAEALAAEMEQVAAKGLVGAYLGAHWAPPAARRSTPTICMPTAGMTAIQLA